MVAVLFFALGRFVWRIGLGEVRRLADADRVRKAIVAALSGQRFSTSPSNDLRRIFHRTYDPFTYLRNIALPRCRQLREPRLQINFANCGRLLRAFPLTWTEAREGWGS